MQTDETIIPGWQGQRKRGHRVANGIDRVKQTRGLCLDVALAQEKGVFRHRADGEERHGTQVRRAAVKRPTNRDLGQQGQDILCPMQAKWRIHPLKNDIQRHRYGPCFPFAAVDCAKKGAVKA
ncbi:MAG: hypothetical protein V4630_18315 [Pseudomonadota bacterium]